MGSINIHTPPLKQPSGAGVHRFSVNPASGTGLFFVSLHASGTIGHRANAISAILSKSAKGNHHPTISQALPPARMPYRLTHEPYATILKL